MERELIRLIDADDTQLDVELISILEDNFEKYIIYTKGESQKNGNLIIYVSKLKIKEGKYYLENVHSDDEWSRIKMLLSDIINK